MTEKRYLIEPDLVGRATIVEQGDDGRPWVRLDRTWFHPQGGGQKPDRGNIGGVAVVHVAHDGDNVVHYLENPIPAGLGVDVAVDGDHRLENSRWHTAGHLIASLAERDWPGLKAISGHHWPGEARVEFAGGRDLDSSMIADRLAGALEQAIQEDLPVRIAVETCGLRIVTIGDFPPIACGGTHVPTTSAVGPILLTKARWKDGKLRLSYQMSPVLEPQQESPRA